MKSFLHIVILYLAVLMLQGCHRISPREYLAEAEQLMETSPDSADARLNNINPRRLRGEEKALYAILRIMVDAKKGEPLKDDSLLRIAYEYYAKKSAHGEGTNMQATKYFAQASIYMGDWYALQDSSTLCEEAYRTAIKYSEKCKDWHTEYCTLSRLAKRKINDANKEEGLKLIEEALKIYDKCKDNDINRLSLLLDAANYSFYSSFYSDKDYSKALKYADEVRQYAQKNDLPEWTNRYNTFSTNFYLEIGEYQKALEYAQQIYYEETKSEETYTRKLIVADCYAKCDSISKAIELYRDIIQSEDFETQYIANRALGDLMLQINEKDSAKSYFYSAFECEEIMYFHSLKDKEDYYKVVVQKERNEESLKYKSKLKTRLYLGITAVLLLIIFFILRNQSLRLRAQREHQHNLLIKERYEQEKLVMEKQHLESERQILLEKVRQKEAMVKFLQGYIIERIELVKRVNAKKGAHINLIRKDWMEIESILDEIDDHSISNVRAKMKNLTEEDIRLCMLVRLRMSNPAIGSIYGITTSAVQHRKQKLKKDGFGVTDPSRTLEQVIVSI